MRRFFLTILSILIPLVLEAQEVKHSDPLQQEPVDSIKTKEQIPQDENEIEKSRSSMYTAVNDIDTTRRISYWRITKRTGEIIPGNPDTLLTDFVNRLHADGMSVSMAYPGNLGLPMESRIYFDRQDRSNFMFADHYYNYAFTPEKHHFINTKIPYSNFTYHSAGSRETKEERLLGALSINFGKKLNFGFNVDYLYARGFYMSQAAKRLDWNFYGSYISDRHRLHLFINPTDYSNGENGGISNDLYITDPLSITNEKLQSRQIPVNYQRADGVQHTWNHQKGGEYYLNYHYNLGFEKDTDKKNEDGEVIKQFIPVSSIIYTFNYINKKRRFNATDSTTIDAFYNGRDAWGTGIAPNDSTSYMEMHNTLGLSMREGFSQWAQFDLTAFLSFERRNYTFMPDMITQKEHDSQNAIYIGGEIAKRTGKILRYEAYGRFGIVGDNLGDIDISGKIETRIPLFKDTASVSGRASIKNLSPTFYEKNFHSKYFWWDNMDFSKVNKIRFGGTIDFPQTKTNVSVDVENITNYIYFDEAGYVRQEPGSIQVLAVTLAQNLRLGILHWDNQLVYQTSSNQDIIPLPDLSAYSNLYLQFLVAKVLTIQLGGNAHYFSKYYSPIYEPTTQQFRLQKNTQVGNYPIISGYVNCHLKYTRFFIEFYNLSASFIDPPEYFSMPSYPLNPQMFKFGLSWDFHN